MMQKWIRAGGKRACYSFIVVCLSVMLAAPGIARSAHAAASQRLVIGSMKPQSQVERQVRDWIAQLSDKQPFTAWKQATPSIQPLGPGTHSWLATLQLPDRQIVGYMVVHAAPDGTLHLGEYGTGPSPLFDAAALRTTLQENGLIDTDQPDAYIAVPHYDHPFAAAWHVTIGKEQYLVDAKTNELLPPEAASRQQSNTKSQPDAVQQPACERATEQPAFICGAIDAIWIGETFDAYERLPWVSGQPPADVTDMEKAQRLIQGELRLKYVTEPYGKAALFALPVIGFIRYSGGRLDVALDMSGARFVPLATLLRYGQFYD